MRSVGRWVIVCGLLLALLAAGCAAPQQPAPAPTPGPAPQQPAAGAPAAPQLSREQRLVEGAKKEGEVVLWAHFFPDSDRVVKLFEARYPFLKLKVWDSRGTEILAKMAEEGKVGRRSVDVLILSSEIVEAHELGLLTEYEFPNVAGWDHQPKHNFFKAYAGSGRGVVYNTNLVPAAEVPKTWDDVKSAKWAGRAFASTSGEDTPLFWAYLWREGDKLNWDKSFAFWTDVIKNTRPRVVGGFTGPLERLVAGEAAIFPAVAMVSIFRMQARGAPLAIAPLGVVSGDTAGIALVKGAPHPDAGRLLIDWLTGPEGLLAYANTTYYQVLNPKLEDKARGNAILKSMGLGWEPLPRELMTGENLKKSADFWMKALGVRG